MKGTCISTLVGTKGSGPLQFQALGGIAISPINKYVYVTDHYHNCVQVMTDDFIFVRMFSSKGSENGQFNTPYDVAIDKKGLLYITDYGNHHIQTFTPEGKYLNQFGTKGTGPGQLTHPQGITVDNCNDLVCVTEGGNHRISVFTCDGQFAYTMGEHGVNVDQFDK